MFIKKIDLQRVWVGGWWIHRMVFTLKGGNGSKLLQNQQGGHLSTKKSSIGKPGRLQHLLHYDIGHSLHIVFLPGHCVVERDVKEAEEKDKNAKFFLAKIAPGQ